TENPLFLSRGRVPEAQRAVPIPDRRDAAAIRAKGDNIDGTLMPTQDGSGVVRLTGEVPPLPAAMLGGGIVKRPLGRTDVVRLQRTGGGHQVGPIALPAFSFLLALGFLAGSVGGSSLTRFFLQRVLRTDITPGHEHERREKNADDAGQRRGYQRV